MGSLVLIGSSALFFGGKRPSKIKVFGVPGMLNFWGVSLKNRST